MSDRSKLVIRGKWIDCKKAMPVNHQALERLKVAKQ